MWGFDADGEFQLIGLQHPPEVVEQIRRDSEASYAQDAERSTGAELGFWLRRNFQLLTLLGNGRDHASEVIKGSVAYTTVARAFGREGRRHFPFLDYCEPEDGEDVAYGWRLAEATLRRFRRVAAQADARLYVLVIPDMYQTWPDYYRTTARRYGYDPDAYDLEKPNRVLAALCTELDIACLDLLPLMRDELENGSTLYYRRDRHWTPEGHRVAAGALLLDLEQRGWLDPL